MILSSLPNRREKAIVIRTGPLPMSDQAVDELLCWSCKGVVWFLQHSCLSAKDSINTWANVCAGWLLMRKRTPPCSGTMVPPASPSASALFAADTDGTNTTGKNHRRASMPAQQGGVAHKGRASCQAFPRCDALCHELSWHHIGLRVPPFGGEPAALFHQSAIKSW